MITNSMHTIVIFYQHPQLYFDLFHSYNQNEAQVVGERWEFKRSSYEKELELYLASKIIDNNDRKRIRGALSYDNLLKCDFVAFENESEGTFSLQNFLIEGIQSLDSRLLRELGQPDLDVIYSQIKTVHSYFVLHSQKHSKHDPEFRENLVTLTDTMREIYFKISHNVKALDGSSKRLSEIVDQHDFEKFTPTKQVQEAFSEIIKIYHRNIQPTLRFLNEDAMAKDSSAMLLIKEIIDTLASYKDGSHSNILIIRQKLFNFVGDITEIRTKLHRYIEMNRRQRLLYNAIEKKFNSLEELVHSLFDSKINRRLLDLKNPFFNDSEILSRSYVWNKTALFHSLLEFPNDFSGKLVNEHLRVKLQDLEVFEQKKSLPISNRKEVLSKEHLSSRLKVRNIRIAMSQYKVSDCNDFYSDIHHFLLNNLTSYELPDLYDAVPFVSHKYKIKTTLKRGVIKYGDFSRSYLIRRVEV